MTSASGDRSPPVTLFIEGMASQSASDDAVETINPSTGQHLLAIPAGSAVDVDRAVVSSRRAFEDGRWSEAPPSQKKSILHKFADLIEADAAELDAMDAGEMGKPVGLASGNAAEAAALVRFNAECVDKLGGNVFGSDKKSLVLQRRVPRGVVAAIVPWNFPTYVAALKIAPALAAGNCIVLKPSELSSRSALYLARLALQAGIPPGVFNVVPGLGETVGRALGVHMDIDMIAFTGSTEVGKAMLCYAGQSNMKAVQTECGGKSPQIVFADGVDLDAVSESIAGGMLTNQGQVCSLGSRLVVQQAIQASLLEKITARIQNVVMGNALDPRTTFGPLASKKQYSRVMQYVDWASEDGAHLIVGGKRALLKSGGYFVEPTLFNNVSPNARIAQEEVFGPVLAAIPFTDETEAIRIANGTKFGLWAYVWTTDLSTGMRMAKGIRSAVMVNATATTGEGAGYATSWEPGGQSGIGVESGLAGLEGYMRRQLVWFSHG